ncbi:MAG: FAD binding domain-containing protein [Pseudomonadota bacterium]
MKVRFLLNGDPQNVHVEPTTTLLDWLRESRSLTATKEGCNEGDCGACSVIVTDETGAKCLNACILFLPQLEGKAVRTVEGISGPEGDLHPVQKAMIAHHGTQCGFCTPGFVSAMAAAHLNGRKDFDIALAGNLCRCTGYAPIARAAEAAAVEPVPAWMSENISSQEPGEPLSLADLAEWRSQNPNGTMIAGATDVGLWVTKEFRNLGEVFFLNRVPELAEITETDTEIRIGAMVSVARAEKHLRAAFPSFADLLIRYGSDQVRQAATLGGNIANGSPIGDGSPALIAMRSVLHLRSADGPRSLPLEDFFIDYGVQDLRAGEFVEAISIPKPSPARTLYCYKISKRFDQDISSVCGCISFLREDGVLREPRVAYGGMAGTPKRAKHAEAAMEGRALSDACKAGAEALAADFTPLTDMRASAVYRMAVAQSLFERIALAEAGEAVDVGEVTA